MKNKSVLIWGASGHAKVAVDIFKCQKQYKIISFIENISKKSKRFFFATQEGTPLLNYCCGRLWGMIAIYMFQQRRLLNLLDHWCNLRRWAGFLLKRK